MLTKADGSVGVLRPFLIMDPFLIPQPLTSALVPSRSIFSACTVCPAARYAFTTSSHSPSGASSALRHSRTCARVRMPAF